MRTSWRGLDRVIRHPLLDRLVSHSCRHLDVRHEHLLQDADHLDQRPHDRLLVLDRRGELVAVEAEELNVGAGKVTGRLDAEDDHAGGGGLSVRARQAQRRQLLADGALISLKGRKRERSRQVRRAEQVEV